MVCSCVHMRAKLSFEFVSLCFTYTNNRSNHVSQNLRDPQLELRYFGMFI